MREQELEMMFRCDQQAIEMLRNMGKVSPDRAVSLAIDFLRHSADNGRHSWGGFRNDVLQSLIDLCGRSPVEERLLSEWPAFPEESRLDFAYDVIARSTEVSKALAERLFYHHATSTQCKINILDGLLQARERRQLDEGYFSGLIDRLSSQATPTNRDDVDIACMQMCEMILEYYV